MEGVHAGVPTAVEEGGDATDTFTVVAKTRALRSMKQDLSTTQREIADEITPHGTPLPFTGPLCSHPTGPHPPHGAFSHPTAGELDDAVSTRDALEQRVRDLADIVASQERVT
jgi:hypothetical protein